MEDSTLRGFKVNRQTARFWIHLPMASLHIRNRSSSSHCSSPPPHPSCFTFLRHKNSMLRDPLFHTVYCTIAAITVACILSFQLYAPYWLLTDVDGQTGPHRPARQTDHVYRNASLPWKDKKSFATSVSLLRQQYTWNAPMKVHSSDCPFQSQSGQINQDAACVGSQHL